MSLETVTTLEKSTIDKLNDLIQVNIDSQKGFAETAEHLNDLSIASMFRDLASQRAQQADELKAIVESNAKEPAHSGSMAAAAHRVWIDFRDAIGGGTTAMLEEAERGEDIIKAQYEDILKETGGSAVTDVLNRHYAAVKSSHDRIRDMRDAHKADH